MHRFFIPPECIQEKRVEFPLETAHQIARVLRLRNYERVGVLDNRGNEYEVELEVVNVRGVSGNITAIHNRHSEPQSAITLYLGLTQREKFEWILQKCTELGVAAFVPLLTQRSLVQSAQEVENKYERWQKIIREAAEQSGRVLCPLLHPVQALEKISVLPATQAGFVLWEEEHSLSFRHALEQSQEQCEIALLIGPEGGLSAAEVELAKSAGFKAVTLGKRILRMETAAVVAAAVALYQRGDLDGA
jgi:16S rRNA (uracil1498-N3)-methyltransferase